MPHTPHASLEGLVSLSRREGVDIRPALLRVVTDLYVQQKAHTREEEQQYVELALGLLPAVDVATRSAVAGKLAVYGHPPAPVVALLAQDVPQVASVIAGAAVMAEPPPDVAVEPAAATPAATPAPTPPAPIPSPSPAYPAADLMLDDVFDDAPATRAMAEPASRAATSDPIGERFLRATSDERVRMLAEDDEQSAMQRDPLMPADRAEVIQRLEQFALARQPDAFAKELVQSLRLPPATAERIVQDTSGEPLLVAARALGMPGAVLQRIIMFLNPAVGESVERVFALSRLYYELTARAALPILMDWRQHAPRRTGTRYVGVHADEAANGATAVMDNARRAVTGRIGDTRRDAAANRPLRQRT